MGISRKVRQIKVLSLELPAAENGQGRRTWLAHRWLLLGAVSLLVVVDATAYILARSRSDHAKAPKITSLATPAWVGWLGSLVPGSFGNIDQRILGRSIAAEIALHSREAGEVTRENAAMKKLAAQFNSVH
jgi:hypothetical protein